MWFFTSARSDCAGKIPLLRSSSGSFGRFCLDVFIARKAGYLPLCVGAIGSFTEKQVRTVEFTYRIAESTIELKRRSAALCTAIRRSLLPIPAAKSTACRGLALTNAAEAPEDPGGDQRSRCRSYLLRADQTPCSERKSARRP